MFLFMDISSEMIHSLLQTFVVGMAAARPYASSDQRAAALKSWTDSYNRALTPAFKA